MIKKQLTIQNIFKVIIFSFIIFSGFLFASERAQAQTGECVIRSADWRVYQGGRDRIDPYSWFRDERPPYAYVDIATSGCVGENLRVEILFGEFRSTAGRWLTGENIDIKIETNNLVNVEDNNFTLLYKAGEFQCNKNNEPNCFYVIRVGGRVLGSTGDNWLNTSSLTYQCHDSTPWYNPNVCDKKWTYIGKIDYKAIHSEDHNKPGRTPSDDVIDPDGGFRDSDLQRININLQNPIGSADMTIVDLIQKLLKLVVTVGIPLVAIAIIYSGLLFVTARGNDKQLETAKNAFTYSVIGGAIILGCWIFAGLIKNMIEAVAMIISYFV